MTEEEGITLGSYQRATAKIAQLEEALAGARAELNETWYEPKEHGPDAWRRPTAEAYGRVCVLLRKAEAKLAAFNHDRCSSGFRSLLKTAEAENKGLREALEKIQVRAERHQFDTGAVARGCVQVIRGICDAALARTK